MMLLDLWLRRRFRMSRARRDFILYSLLFSLAVGLSWGTVMGWAFSPLVGGLVGGGLTVLGLQFCFSQGLPR